MAKPMPVIQLTDQIRQEMIETLADDMRAYLKKHEGLIRTFVLDRDLPLSVVYGAMRSLYGDGLERVLKGWDGGVGLMDDRPAIYLSEDPSEKA